MSCMCDSCIQILLSGSLLIFGILSTIISNQFFPCVEIIQLTILQHCDSIEINEISHNWFSSYLIRLSLTFSVPATICRQVVDFWSLLISSPNLTCQIELKTSILYVANIITCSGVSCSHRLFCNKGWLHYSQYQVDLLDSSWLEKLPNSVNSLSLQVCFRFFK